MQFKQWFESNQKMVQALSTLAGKISPNKRIHLSANKIEAINDKSQDLQPGHFRVNGKPFGLWYGVGTQWIDFVVNEMPKGVKTYIYELIVDLPKILVVQDEKHATEIEKEYGVWSDFHKFGWYDPAGAIQHIQHHDNGQTVSTQRPKLIDWQKAGQKYFGVEVNPEKIYSPWSDRWDVHSGCVWNKSGIISLQLIAEYDPQTSTYQMKG